MSATRELKVAARLAAGRTLLRIGGLTGSPVARLLATRPVDDPFPLLARIRAAGAVATSPIGVFATASHRQVAEILRDGAVWVQTDRVRFFGVDWTRGPADRALPHPVDDSLLTMNPPDHTTLRRLVAPAFTPRALRDRVPGIRRVVAEFLDRAAERGTFDVVRDFAVRVPLRVICELLNVPEERSDDFMRWGNTLTECIDGVRTMGERRRARRAVLGISAFLDELIELRRREPGDDVLSRLVTGDDGAGPAGHRQAAATAGLLVGAGYETTVGLIGNGVRAMLDHPEHIPTLVSDEDFAAEVVEEVLRYDPPVRFTSRIPNRDVTLDGVRIPAGSQVMLMLAGANRDPATFADPDRFDPYRANNREHLSFAAGAHFCLGAGLARLEGAIALRELFTRFPGLRLTGPVRVGRSRNLRHAEHMPASTGA